jgi:hypothetical protein
MIQILLILPFLLLIIYYLIQRTQAPPTPPPPPPPPPEKKEEKKEIKVAKIELSVDSTCKEAVSSANNFVLTVKALDDTGKGVANAKIQIIQEPNTLLAELTTNYEGIAKAEVTCDPRSPYKDVSLYAYNKEFDVKSNKVIITCCNQANCCKQTTTPQPNPPTTEKPSPPPESTPPTTYDKDCNNMGIKVGESIVDANVQDLVNLFGYKEDEAREIVDEKLAKLRVVECRDGLNRPFKTIYLIETKPFAFVSEIAKVTWLWIKTDIDCRNVRCIAFWNDAYAYEISQAYDPSKDRYRYFVQTPTKKKIVYEIRDNQAIPVYEKILALPTQVCGIVKVVQQAYPYMMRQKQICFDPKQDEIFVDLVA